MAKEAQSSVGYGEREELATRDVSDFNIGHMTGVSGMRRIFGMAHVSNASMRSQRYFVVDHVSVSHSYSKTGTNTSDKDDWHIVNLLHCETAVR